MKYIKYITILFFIFVLFFVNNSYVSAQQTCFTNPETGDWALCEFDPNFPNEPPTCETTGSGGSQEAYDCCVSAGTSTCEAPTGGGGGGGGYQPLACGSGTVLTCGSPTVYAPATYDPNLAQCQYLIECDAYFPSKLEVNGCDGKEVKGICQSNCGCCSAGSTYQRTQTTGSTYTKEISCFTQTAQACNDWDDVAVSGSRVISGGSGNCYCDCQDENVKLLSSFLFLHPVVKSCNNLSRQLEAYERIARTYFKRGESARRWNS